MLGALSLQRAGIDENRPNLAELTRPPYPSGMTMSGPRPDQCPEDRFLACEQDLEAEFQALVFNALKAGWGEGEACVAIASLADHHILALIANDETRRQIASSDPSGIVLRNDG